MRKVIASVITTIVVITLLIALAACGASSGDVYAKDHIEQSVHNVQVSDYQYVCYPVVRTRYSNGQTTTYIVDRLKGRLQRLEEAETEEYAIYADNQVDPVKTFQSRRRL